MRKLKIVILEEAIEVLEHFLSQYLKRNRNYKIFTREHGYQNINLSFQIESAINTNFTLIILLWT